MLFPQKQTPLLKDPNELGCKPNKTQMNGGDFVSF